MKKQALFFVAAIAALSLPAQAKVAGNGKFGEGGSITRADVVVMPGGKLSMYNRTNCKLILDEGDEVNIAKGAECSFNGGQIIQMSDL